MQPRRSGPPPLKLACRPPSALAPLHCRLPVSLVGDGTRRVSSCSAGWTPQQGSEQSLHGP